MTDLSLLPRAPTAAELLADAVGKAQAIVSGDDLSPLAWPEEHPQLRAVCWHVLAACQQRGGVARPLQPEDYPKVALEFLRRRRTLRVVEHRAAERLVHLLLRDDETSTEALTLLTAFALGLGALAPALAEAAWDTLVGASWHIEQGHLVELALASRTTATGLPRDLLDVVEARVAAEGDADRVSTRELAEALVAAWARRSHRLEDLTPADALAPSRAFTGTDDERVRRALRVLARLHLGREEADGLVARVVTAWAAEQTDDPELREVAARTLQERLWRWSYAEWVQVASEGPGGVDAAVARAMRLYDSLREQGPERAREHVHDALRTACEALLVTLLRPSMGRWLPDLLRSRPPEDEVRDAVEHLTSRNLPRPDPDLQRIVALLVRVYVLVDDGRPHAEALVRWAYRDAAWLVFHEGAPLADLRDAVAAYVARAEDRRAESARLAETLAAELAVVRRDTPAEERDVAARNDAWVAEVVEQARQLPAVIETAPARTTAGRVEAVLRAALEWTATTGGPTLDALLAEGVALREKGDLAGLRARAEAIGLTERWVAGGLSGTSGLALGIVAPPLAVVGATADLGFVLGIALRVCAQQAALFGRDPRTPEGVAFVMYALVAAVSSRPADGALPYLADPGLRDVIASRGAAEAVIVRLAPVLAQRLAGQAASRAVAAVVPLASAAAHGALSWRLVDEVRRTAVEIGHFQARRERASQRGDSG